MSLLNRIADKARFLLVKHLLHRFGFGSRVSRSVWEKQFATGVWDYLESGEEAGHYRSIVRMYAQSNADSVLDVGCGKGVLYDYLKAAGLMPERYTGIDISQNAVAAASKKFPEANFYLLDFEKTVVNQKFDLIIFNETLYYFNRPLRTLKMCCAKNLNPSGFFIISMCDYTGHDVIWQRITKSLNVVNEEEIINNRNQKWKIKQLKPL